MNHSTIKKYFKHKYSHALLLLSLCFGISIASSFFVQPFSTYAATTSDQAATGDSYTEFRFQRSSFYMYAGSTIEFQPMLTSAFEYANASFTCKSNNTKVAKITKTGKLTGVAPGKAKITCTYTVFGKTKKCSMVIYVKESINATGTSYFDYSQNGTTLTITGLKKSKKNLVIPAYINGYPVTAIGAQAFYESTIQKVTLPSTVTQIEKNAFRASKSLSTVQGGKKLKNIEAYAFYDCPKLKSFAFSDTLATIGDSAFRNTAITKLPNLSKLKSIDEYAFYNCQSLTQIGNFPKLESIGKCAFYCCSSLKKTGSYPKLQSIGSDAFHGTAITKFPTAKNLTTIGASAFCGLAITELPTLNKLTSIGEYAFYNCQSLTKIGDYPKLTSIGEYAFYNCQSLTKIGDYPKLASIGEYAFYNCQFLTKIGDYPKLASIGEYAFYNCQSLTKIGDYPKLTSIGEYSFTRTGLSDLDNPAYFTSQNWSDANIGSLVHFGSYEQDNNLENGAEDIVWSVKEVEEDYLLLQSYSVFASTYFSSNDEIGCSWASSTLRKWLNETFYSTSFTEEEQSKIALTLVNNWESGMTFWSSTKKNNMEDTKDYIHIPPYSIIISPDDGNKFTTYVTIWVAKSGTAGEKNYYTTESIFETTDTKGGTKIIGISDKTIETLYIPPTIHGKKVVALAANAFAGCEKLHTIKIPENVTTISENAFAECPALTNVYFPSSLEKLSSTTLTETMINLSYAPDICEDIQDTILRFKNRDIWQVIESDTSRWGVWDLTYKEFIEIYQSIGTENDLFIKMLAQKGPRHTDDGSYFQYDGVADLDIEFESITAEKLYALHYAPFEYNHDDLVSGQWGKEQLEAYEDHGGVCGILTDTYLHFIKEILGERNWTYYGYGNDEVNHAALLVKTEDGKIFQIDNCGVDYWWLGLNFLPNTETPSAPADETVVQAFDEGKQNYLTLDNVYWHTFALYTQNGFTSEWDCRPIWLNYETNQFETYLTTEMPTSFKVVCTGLPGKIISMAGNTNLEGYINLSELTFE